MKTAVCAAVAALLALAAPAISAAAEADVLRQVQDREQIAQLMWRYNRALDTLNPDAYVQTYTPDGAFGQVKGREALFKFIDGLRKARDERAAKGEPAMPGMYHVETNEHVEFTDADHARVYYYWMTVFAGATQKDPARIAAVGHGVDDLVRTDGHWLIQLRNVTPKD